MSLSHEPLDPLTPREQEILLLLVRGFSDQEIAQELVLTVSTVKWYNRQIYSKLGVNKRSMAVVQAHHLGLVDSLSEARGVSARPVHNLPAEVTSFVGRERELAEIRRLLTTARVLTLAGAPGAGKTRLALRAAWEAIPAYRDGVFFVPLALITQSDLVLMSIAKTLGIEDRGGSALSSLVKQYLAQRQLLLVLDNFEHVLEAASLVGELVAAAAGLTVMITSRELLNLYGEHEYAVPPLEPPDLNLALDLNRIRTSEAVQLFVQRAQAAVSAFTLSEENAASIAVICTHLDGLPLAIELAAARIRLYSPQSLLLRLSSRLEALTDGPRDLPARHRTLRSTLAWSYHLLDPDEQALFARLGIFSGGCTYDSADYVCGQGLDVDPADTVASLFNKNLLRSERDSEAEPRFMMLETIREYALEQLDQRGERASLGQRHADYFLAYAERASALLFGQKQREGLLLFEAEYDNLRAALKWSVETAHAAETSFRLVARLASYWEFRGQLKEGRNWLHEVLTRHAPLTDNRAYADALYSAADLAYYQSDYPASRQWAEQALAIYRALDERRSIAQALMVLGNIATEVGDYEVAPGLFEEAYEIMRGLEDVIGSARALSMLGWCALRPGDDELARKRLQAALDLYQQVEDANGIGLTLSGLGEIALRQGDLPAANNLLEQSLVYRRGLDDRWGIAASLGSLGWAALREGDCERATAYLTESLTIRHEIGDVGGAAWCLERLGELSHLQKRSSVAARLLGAAAALRESVHSVIDPADVPHYQKIVSALRDQLGHAEFDRAWDEGQSMSTAQVLAWLEVLARS